MVVYNLAAKTNYDFVGFSLISSDLDILANATIADGATNISVDVDLTTLVRPNDYFDVGVRSTCTRMFSF